MKFAAVFGTKIRVKKEASFSAFLKPISDSLEHD